MIIRVVHYRPEGIVLQMLPAEHYRTLIYGLRVGMTTGSYFRFIGRHQYTCVVRDNGGFLAPLPVLNSI